MKKWQWLIVILIIGASIYGYIDWNKGPSIAQVPKQNLTPSIKPSNQSNQTISPVRYLNSSLPSNPIKNVSPADHSKENLTRVDTTAFDSKTRYSPCGKGVYEPENNTCLCQPGAFIANGKCKTNEELCGTELMIYDTAQSLSSGSAVCKRRTDCKTLENIEWRDDCYTISAIQVSDCNKLNRSDNKKRCESRFADNKPAISIPCERITDPKVQALCLYTLGLLALNEDVCLIIDRQNKAEDCASEVRSIISSCDAQDTQEGLTACLSSLAAKSMNPSICDKITDLKLRKSCEIQGRRTQTPTAKKEIIDLSNVQLVS